MLDFPKMFMPVKLMPSWERLLMERRHRNTINGNKKIVNPFLLFIQNERKEIITGNRCRYDIPDLGFYSTEELFILEDGNSHLHTLLVQDLSL